MTATDPKFLLSCGLAVAILATATLHFWRALLRRKLRRKRYLAGLRPRDTVLFHDETRSGRIVCGEVIDNLHGLLVRIDPLSASGTPLLVEARHIIVPPDAPRA